LSNPPQSPFFKEGKNLLSPSLVKRGYRRFLERRFFGKFQFNLKSPLPPLGKGEAKKTKNEKMDY